MDQLTARARTDGSVPEPIHAGDIVYVSLWVPDADRAATFFGSVLGWSIEPRTGDRRQVTGQTIHHGIMGGHDRSTLFPCFAVDDLPAAIERVRHAGGQAGEPQSESHGVTSDGTDDQGVPFALYQMPGPDAEGRVPRLPVNGDRHGDVSYVTLEVQDSARTRAFFGSVLGWEFQPGSVDDGWQVEGIAPMTGLHGGHPAATGVPMYRVDDIDSAVVRVRAAGGTATDPEVQPYGVTSVCTDDQGTHFYLGQH